MKRRKGGQPGNTNGVKPPSEHSNLVRTQVRLRPDQRDALDTLPHGQRSEVMRRALDAFFTTHPISEVDYAAILDAMAEEPDELYERE